MTFRKDEWALRIDGGMTAVTVSVWVWCGLLVSPVTRVNVPWLMKLPRRGFMVVKFLSEGLSLGGVQRKPVPILPFLKCLQLKITNYQNSVFWVACPELLPSYFGVAYSATLQRKGETYKDLFSKQVCSPMLSDYRL